MKSAAYIACVILSLCDTSLCDTTRRTKVRLPYVHSRAIHHLIMMTITVRTIMDIGEFYLATTIYNILIFAIQ